MSSVYQPKRKELAKVKVVSSNETQLRSPDKNYRIHDEDKERVKKYKKSKTFLAENLLGIYAQTRACATVEKTRRRKFYNYYML